MSLNKLPFKIKEIRPSIFLAKFKDPYTCAMFFWKYQEFYESPNPKFRNNVINLSDYMDWYVKKFKKKSFTYAADYTGFNIPSESIRKCLSKHKWEPQTRYDEMMDNLFLYLQHSMGVDENHKWKPFYLIGVAGKGSALDHEIAHGMYSTNSEYKIAMDAVIRDLPRKNYQDLRKVLAKSNYAREVLDDEIQAYLSTGLSKFLLEVSEVKKLQPPFKKIFKKFENGNYI